MQTTRNVSSIAGTSNNLHVSTTGNDGVVYGAWWSWAFGWVEFDHGRDWRRLGGFFPKAAPLAPVIRPNLGMAWFWHLFVTGNNGVVYTSFTQAGETAWTGEADNWHPLGGFFPAGAPLAAVAITGKNLDLFVVGNDGAAYTNWWTAGEEWVGLANNWPAMGGSFPPGTPLSAVTISPWNIDVFGIDREGTPCTNWWEGGEFYVGWQPMPGPRFPAGAPISCVSISPSYIDVFATGADGVVYTAWWEAGSPFYTAWEPIGGFFPPGAPVSAVSISPRNIDLFVVGNDGVVYTSWWEAGEDYTGVANNWLPIGGFFPPGNPVAAVSRTSDSIDLFVVGNDGVVYTSRWESGQEYSGVNNNWRPLIPRRFG